MIYTIEKNVPIAEMLSRTGRKPKYPFAQMEVGDSFFVETDLEVVKSTRVYRAAMSYSRSHGVKFSGRKVEGGIRIWRTA